MKYTHTNSLVKLLFFGNYFYGFCTIGLSVEAALQQKTPLNTWDYYLLLFILTILYYSHAYLKIENKPDPENLRATWYNTNARAIMGSLWVYTLIGLVLSLNIIMAFWSDIMHLTALEIFLILLFPFSSLLYYGINTPTFTSFNLRNIGWLKPFIIGFIWAGVVTIYPVLYYSITHQVHYELNLIACLLFLKNFMFVTVLAILFDIKDYAKDYNEELKTLVVKLGLRKTIYFIILPLLLLGLSTFILYGLSRQFHYFKIMFNTLPFLITILVAFQLQKRKSIFFYLVVIDGLMLLKAICGSIGMYYF